MANRSRLAGFFNAVDYAYGAPGAGFAPALVIDIAPAATGAGTVTVAFGQVALSDGTPLAPLATNAPILVGTGTDQETVTPSAVSNGTVNGYDVTSFTATFSNLHGKGEPVASGTFGLQEAINDANARGGGVVCVDGLWVAVGGTSAMLAAAVLPANGSVALLDNRNGQGTIQQLTVLVPNSAVLTLESAPLLLIPAPGAGNAIIVEEMTVENVFKTAAYAGSPGVIAAQYGSAAGQTNPATATIAAAFLTGPVANQIIRVAGALASTLSSAILNVGVYLSVLTNNPTTGAGSLIVKISYRILTAL